MSLRALIVDDERLARRGLRLLLERAGDVNIVHECADGPSAIEAIRSAVADVVFLDVELPGMTGFDVVHEIGPHLMPHVIFVTAFDRYAVRAYDISALDYLLKPINEERLAVALQRARDAVLGRHKSDSDEHVGPPERYLNQQGAALRSTTRPGYFPVRTRERIVLLRMREISAVVASGNYVSLHTKEKTWLARDTITDIEAWLAPFGFVRIHRSTIINIEQVQALRPLANGEFDVVLEDGQEFHLSRSYRDALEKIVGRKV